MTYDFSGRLKYEDFLKFNRAHLKQYFFGGKRKFILGLALALLLLASASDIYEMAGGKRFLTDTTLLFILILAAVYSVLFLILPKFRYRKLFDSNRFLQEEQTFRITETVISITTPSTSVQITRDKVEKLLCTADLICIYISRMQAHLLPRHYFDNDARFAEISAFIKFHFDPERGDR